MFFIAVLIIILIAAAIPLLIYAKANISVHDEKIHFIVKFIGIPVINRQYTIERKQGKLLCLYAHKKGKKAYVTSLYDIISQKKKDSEKLARAKRYRYLYRRAHISLKAGLSLGTGDAFTTANLCGSTKIASGIISGIYSCKKREYLISIVPIFDGRQFTIDINCIIKLSLANIIIGHLIYKKTKRR